MCFISCLVMLIKLVIYAGCAIKVVSYYIAERLKIFSATDSGEF
jgi:hypothetical protein